VVLKAQEGAVFANSAATAVKKILQQQMEVAAAAELTRQKEHIQSKVNS